MIHEMNLQRMMEVVAEEEVRECNLMILTTDNLASAKTLGEIRV